MKVLKALFICCLATNVLAQEGEEKSSTNNSDGKNNANTRFFGGGVLGGLGGAVNSALSGVNPAFGGINQVPASINPSFGGGFGGVNGALGGGFGGVPGALGGGFGGINPGFGGGFGGGASQTCRRWCRTPERQAYCCESNNEPETLPFVKPGQCPPVRPQCPPVRSFAPPQTCSNDSKCGGVDKCCFDRCLEEHVCKPPVGSGGFGGFGVFGR